MSYIMKTHCSKGHPFVEQNTYWDKNGNRVCKNCTRIRSQILRERKKNGAAKQDHSRLSATGASASG